MNTLNKIAIAITAVIICFGYSCKNNHLPQIYPLRTFNEAEIKIILENAIKIEPADSVRAKTTLFHLPNSTQQQKVTVTTQSFYVYIETDKNGKIILQDKNNKAKRISIIDPTRKPPIVVTPYCSGGCSPDCSGSGCIPEAGTCTITCTGSTSDGIPIPCESICTDYSFAVGWSGYRII